jgi:starch phosphorylase
MAEYIDADISTIQKTIVSHVEYTLARTRFNFDISAGYKAAALSIRDRLIESWNDTQQHATASDPKRVYYLSFEFLIGRSMQNALVNLNLESRYRSALLELGFNLEDLYEEEVDPGLGNGGLGRLAACFLDSLASCDYPGWGYGIRYNYGIFRQKIIKGYQVEVPDYWLATMNPWEIERPDINYNVHFGGHVQKYYENGIERSVWMPGETVVAVAYDTPIPGYDTFNTINLRLWQSRPTNEFDFNAFNSGDYFAALEARRRAETISSVLYPNDSTQGGKELRLRQQYFFCSATIQDIFRRFNKLPRNWDELPEKVAIQLNDTHPAIAVPEMLRILVDVHGLDWQRAWNIVTRVFSYTNHTVMPEALEKWSVELMGRLLPRHLDIIYFMNHIFMEKLKQRYRGDPRLNDKMKDMSLIEEGQPKMVRMANLCVLATHAVNGVAELHTGLVKNVLFKQFNEFFPDKIRNKTNGVTPRRWIHCANTKLSALFTRTLGDYTWLKDLDRLKQLRGKENDADFREKWHKIKRKNKERLAEWVKRNCNVELNPDALFDVMVKRIHEYKRQLLNALYIIHRYLTIKDTPPHQRHNLVKRVFMVGGKAAPGYIAAKKIIRLINGIADVVNNDPQIGDLMKVIFLPNYCVSSAQVIIPGADLTQQISTAGTEASGTSNMKFVMNGGLIIGTMDGANVEIAQEIGQENMFIFGARVEEVERIRAEVRGGKCHAGTRLKRVFGTIRQGMFGNPHEMASIVDNLETNDFYIVCYDFYSYLDAQERVDQTYKNQEQWIKKSILGAIHMGKFSSDRTIREYAQDIWKIEPIEVPVPSESALTRVRSQPYLFDMTKSQENILQEGAERHAVVIKGLEEAHLEETLYDR